MSSHSDSDGDSSAAVAAAMGFSGFGQQTRPSKKRRFNPRADASTSAAAAPRPVAPLPPRPTAANATPLGAPRPRPPTSNLPLHPNPAPGPAAADGVDAPPTQDEGYLTDPDPPPQYVDTSLPVGAPRDLDDPPTAEELAEEQARIDAIVAAGNALYAASAPAATAVPLPLPVPVLPAAGTSAGPAAVDGQAGSRHGFRPSVVASTPGGGFGSVSGSAAKFHPGPGPEGGRGGGGRGGRPARGGEGREWYVGYYDAGSNVNPWARLEAALGLEAKGTWLVRNGVGGKGLGGGEGEGSVAGG